MVATDAYAKKTDTKPSDDGQIAKGSEWVKEGEKEKEEDEASQADGRSNYQPPNI